MTTKEKQSARGVARNSSLVAFCTHFVTYGSQDRLRLEKNKTAGPSNDDSREIHRAQVERMRLLSHEGAPDANEFDADDQQTA